MFVTWEDGSVTGRGAFLQGRWQAGRRSPPPALSTYVTNPLRQTVTSPVAEFDAVRVGSVDLGFIPLIGPPARVTRSFASAGRCNQGLLGNGLPIRALAAGPAGTRRRRARCASWSSGSARRESYGGRASHH